ncbi:MAG TPA: hypothetical protein VNQ77_14445 [Frankiaceae bacterium]|nr:hypothetical protein [Frankiaceae bacterium]
MMGNVLDARPDLLDRLTGDVAVLAEMIELPGAPVTRMVVSPAQRVASGRSLKIITREPGAHAAKNARGTA